MPWRLTGHGRGGSTFLLALALLPPLVGSASISAALRPQPAQPPPHAGTAAGSSAGYVLGAGDLVDLRLRAPRNRELGGRFEILDDGSARLALLGSVVLEGLTVEQATQWLSSLYGRHLPNPELELHVLRPRTAAGSRTGSSAPPTPPTPTGDWGPAHLPTPSPQRSPFTP